MRADALSNHLVDHFFSSLDQKPELAHFMNAMRDEDRNDWRERLAMSVHQILLANYQQDSEFILPSSDEEDEEALTDQPAEGGDDFVGADDEPDEELDDLARRGSTQQEKEMAPSKDQFGGQGGDGPAEAPIHNRIPSGGTGTIPKTAAEEGAMHRGEDPRHLASAATETQVQSPGAAPTTVRSTGVDPRARQFGESEAMHRDRLRKMDQSGMTGANLTEDAEKKRQEWLKDPDNQGKPMPDFFAEGTVAQQRTGGGREVPQGADPQQAPRKE